MNIFKSFHRYILYHAQPFVWMNILALVILFGIRCLEIGLVLSLHADIEISVGMIIPMLVYDALFFLVYVAITAPVYLILQHVGQKIAITVQMVLLSFLVLTSLGVSLYFTTGMIPLSVDLFGYSLADIHETVVTSGGTGIGTILSIIGVAMLIGAIPIVSKNLPTPRWLVTLFFGAVLASIPLAIVVPKDSSDFTPETEYFFVRNKAEYFFAKTIVYAYDTMLRSDKSFAVEYPFLRKYERNDVLGPSFTIGKTPPNLVFIIVEGLGSSFLNGNYYSGFMPYLDSLSNHGLYWENFLSTSGRTFGVLPSLLGSLPYAEKGIKQLGTDMPHHETIIYMLKKNGYYTTFYYGGKSGFDNQDLFLKYQKIDKIVDDQSFPASYEKEEAAENGFSWGYADRDVFRRSIEIISETDRAPRLDIYLTLSTHEPFIPPQKELYVNRFRERLESFGIDLEKKKILGRYENIFATLLYADDAIRYFISEYQKRADYSNTIFCITGDHRLIPVPMGTKIDRYRVPFIIYSPMVKKAKRISSVSTHSDVVPSLTSFLEKYYSLRMPKFVHWIGDGMDTSTAFRNIHSQALMHSKNELTDYLDGKYFYSDGKMFALKEGLDLEEIQNMALQDSIEIKLMKFRKMNDYVCRYNKLYPYRHEVKLITETIDYDAVYRTLSIDQLVSDVQLTIAQEYAFRGKFIEARAICLKLLSINPNYHDVRTLLGRTYSWDHSYDAAREIFNEVQFRDPKYADAYYAQAQVEYWMFDSEKALASINKALDIDSMSVEPRVLKSKILLSLNKGADARIEIERALSIDPSFQDAVEFKIELSN